MKPVLKVCLMAIAYLATFLLGSCTGLIHPACYAYVGAVLPLLTAFIYLYTCGLVRGFGAAALLNGFVLVLLLIAGEADTACIVGLLGLTLIVVLVLTVPVAILAMRLAERTLKKTTATLR